MRIALCFDGSGDFFADDYDKVMKRSFVRQIWETAQMDSPAAYWRGPDMTGLKPDRNSGVTGAEAFLKYLETLYNRGSADHFDIYICGYSRGAMTAIYVANRISAFNRLHKFTSNASNFFKRNLGFAEDQPVPVRVRSMVLFDAVDSDLTMMGTLNSIPPIVEKCRHFVCAAPKTGNMSRDEFNRLVLYRSDPTAGGEKIDVSFHVCTHSCIGGMPGGGDNTKVLPSNKQAASGGAASGLKLMPYSPVLGAGLAAGGAVTAVAKRTFQQEFASSGISVDMDWKVYPGLCEQVNKVLVAHGWGAKIIPVPR